MLAVFSCYFILPLTFLLKDIKIGLFTSLYRLHPFLETKIYIIIQLKIFNQTSPRLHISKHWQVA